MPIKTQRDEQPALNLTPMIDVVFLLIIFFMVATKFSELERNIELEIPEVAAAGSARTPPKPRTVAVFADGHVALDGQSVELDALKRQLSVARATEAELSVIVRGDAECPYQHIAAAMAACRDAGVTDLGMTVRIASQPSTVR